MLRSLGMHAQTAGCVQESICMHATINADLDEAAAVDPELAADGLRWAPSCCTDSPAPKKAPTLPPLPKPPAEANPAAKDAWELASVGEVSLPPPPDVGLLPAGAAEAAGLVPSVLFFLCSLGER